MSINLIDELKNSPEGPIGKAFSSAPAKANLWFWVLAQSGNNLPGQPRSTERDQTSGFRLSRCCGTGKTAPQLRPNSSSMRMMSSSPR